MSKRTIVAPEGKTKRIDLAESATDAETPSEFQSMASHRRALARHDSKKQFTSIVEELVNDTSGLVLNVKFPGADEQYPDYQQALFRFVSKVYPNALGGPLYVDTPRNENEIYRAYERQKVMKQLGHRHIIVERDSTLEHLLEQLGEM